MCVGVDCGASPRNATIYAPHLRPYNKRCQQALHESVSRCQTSCPPFASSRRLPPPPYASPAYAARRTRVTHVSVPSAPAGSAPQALSPSTTLPAPFTHMTYCIHRRTCLVCQLRKFSCNCHKLRTVSCAFPATPSPPPPLLLSPLSWCCCCCHLACLRPRPSHVVGASTLVFMRLTHINYMKDILVG